MWYDNSVNLMDQTALVVVVQNAFYATKSGLTVKPFLRHPEPA
jgi:hypothetical protein